MTTANSDRASVVSAADTFLFDLQGYLLLKGALSKGDKSELLDEVMRLEAKDFDTSHFRPPANGPFSHSLQSVLDRTVYSRIARLESLVTNVLCKLSIYRS